MYNHILTSIIGSHPNIQDAIKYFEDNDRIIAVVADGLGSRRKSVEGARLICKLIAEEMLTKKLPLHSNDIESINNWYRYLEEKDKVHDDYCTTCSFAIIDKNTKQISLGQLGDSPIFVCIDNKAVVEMRQEKEFSNLTDCLGVKNKSQFSINNYSYSKSINILVTSDGIGDELDSLTLDSLFLYLSTKYQSYSLKSRSRRFTKEMKATIGKVNHDDKSAIYIWSK